MPTLELETMRIVVDGSLGRLHPGHGFLARALCEPPCCVGELAS